MVGVDGNASIKISFSDLISNSPMFQWLKITGKSRVHFCQISNGIHHLSNASMGGSLKVLTTNLKKFIEK
jgi:hypothetical protein